MFTVTQSPGSSGVPLDFKEAGIFHLEKYTYKKGWKTKGEEKQWVLICHKKKKIKKKIVKYDSLSLLGDRVKMLRAKHKGSFVCFFV